jgi:hypothetical protein
MRNIVRTSIGGSTARIRLSNQCKTAPLVISDMHSALNAEDDVPTIVSSSDVVVTFNGAKSVTIPVGEIVMSDSAVFPVPTLGNVAITMYPPGPVPTVITEHFFSAEQRHGARRMGGSTAPGAHRNHYPYKSAPWQQWIFVH